MISALHAATASVHTAAAIKPALSMMLSLYVTLGVFLLLAIRNPLANRSVIAFTAWSSFAHAAVRAFHL